MATRQRTTFRYRSDEDHEQDIDIDMDEEEQEHLIEKLKAQNQSTNDIYIKAFTIFPLAITPLFIFYLLSPNSINTTRLLSLLSITSLLGSAFRMWFVPYSTESKANARVRKLGFLDLEIDHDGPLGRVLPWMNIGICGILIISAWGVRRRSVTLNDMPEGFWLFLLLPSVVLCVVAVAKQSMSDVERGIGELGQLRYELKGA